MRKKNKVEPLHRSQSIPRVTRRENLETFREEETGFATLILQRQLLRVGALTGGKTIHFLPLLQHLQPPRKTGDTLVQVIVTHRLVYRLDLGPTVRHPACDRTFSLRLPSPTRRGRKMQITATKRHKNCYQQRNILTT